MTDKYPYSTKLTDVSCSLLIPYQGKTEVCLTRLSIDKENDIILEAEGFDSPIPEEHFCETDRHKFTMLGLSLFTSKVRELIQE